MLLPLQITLCDQLQSYLAKYVATENEAESTPEQALEAPQGFVKMAKKVSGPPSTASFNITLFSRASCLMSWHQEKRAPVDHTPAQRTSAPCSPHALIAQYSAMLCQTLHCCTC